MNINIKQFKLVFICFILAINTSNFKAQQQINYLYGKVVENDSEGNPIPLVGASIYWESTTDGTSSDISGDFKIEKHQKSGKLIVSYVGYKNDTIEANGLNKVNVVLQKTIDLEEVTIIKRVNSTQISLIEPIKVEKIGEKELLKAACCNLSESFETSPSVDVSFTDAVTGTRQIQMLGLAGQYTQINRENIPDIRGLSSIYGLTFVPGTWVESIQLNKGTGSVVNGYESIAGQINVELRKPENADPLYVNLYVNEGSRVEANVNIAKKFNDKWSMGWLLHGKNNSVAMDRNADGFMDHPTGTSFIAINRWKYIGENDIRAQLGIKATVVDNTGGQMGFDEETSNSASPHWGYLQNINRYEVWAKLGKVFPEQPWKGIGFQLSALHHDQKSSFGLRGYDAKQASIYSNFLYNGIIGNTFHKYRLGASFLLDDYNEIFIDTSFAFQEVVPGVYFEYTYKKSDKFSLVSGIRYDYHNLYGSFITPRLHLRYAISDNLILRGSAGRGQKTASVIAENSGLLSSSREFIIKGKDNDLPYGLLPEKAWNYGINLTKKFTLDFRDGDFSFDFYRTDFTNQVVVDLYQSARYVEFYNLEGSSYSNSFQFITNYEVIKRLDVRLAYRWFDVKSTYNGTLKQKPLVAAHRAFVNLMYSSRKHWTFDFTANWQGQKQLPFTGDNDVQFQLKKSSPSFVLMNAQVSKVWNEKFEVYTGVENIMNFKQKNPILASEDPFGKFFDSSMIWGSVFGRNIYMGIRYKIKYQ